MIIRKLRFYAAWLRWFWSSPPRGRYPLNGEGKRQWICAQDQWEEQEPKWNG